MNREQLPQTVENEELLSGEDEKLCQLLGNLRKVNAPSNFDFALNRRIAEKQTQIPSKFRFFYVLRYAAPLALLILLAGFVVLNLSFSSAIEDVPQVTENSPLSPKIQTAENPTTEQVTREPATIAVNNTLLADSGKLPKQVSVSQNSTATKNLNNPKSPKNDDNEFGGTLEPASTGATRIILPNGLNANRKTFPPADFANQPPISVSDVLLQIGIEIDANRQIKSVKQNSLAEKSGVQAGDIIEAIDETKLTSETVFTKSFSGKTLHLLRNGKKIAAELGKP